MRALVCQKYPSADGILLAADVYLPEGPGPFPVILTRTPYDRVGHLSGHSRHFVERGYAYVAADCRGRYESDGHFTRMFDEAVDGQATLDWVADQKWCNGRIGMWGISYGGAFQVPAAIGGHEALRCICPSVVCVRFFENWSRYDGAFALRNPLWWVMGHGTGRTTPPTHHVNWDELYRMESLDQIEQAVGFKLPLLREIAAHDANDAYWEQINQWPMHPKVSVPGMHTAAWFDHVSSGQYEAYQRIRDLGSTDTARNGQRLFVGPWGHLILQTGNQHRRYGEWDFGEAADVSVVDYHLRFLDLYLKDVDDGISEEAPVRVFLMGENRWLDLPDWPPPEARIQKWHLDSQGNAHGPRGNGALTLCEPAVSASDELVYDPADPVPTCGGQIFWNMEPRGPRDQRHLLERDDVLFYQSEPLGKPLTVIGDVSLDLTVASDVDDTDIVAKLCVIEQDESVTCIILGSFRCRYREGWDRRVPFEHGEPTPLRIRLSQLAYVFPANSRIALMVTSSDFPRIQPHTNTMAKPWETAAAVVAHTQVMHGGGLSASLNLPVVEL
ncbi:MAG: CocE/NonD family hydrolase [Lentisphaerae bacterium]|nr:CocE/NonD family hydrolase [Lentisphaerota bacterium]MBT5605303.1 CocE/NonD family hydrolase [Lentisphaerota bacterium]MBT7057547.1 CocE/NonD family hydrolase [Lentisphaerota bacterium]MBT7840687.1 CocE/NonD family hydrolase [Lentisphaerota bacterium]